MANLPTDLGVKIHQMRDLTSRFQTGERNLVVCSQLLTLAAAFRDDPRFTVQNYASFLGLRGRTKDEIYLNFEYYVHQNCGIVYTRAK